MPAAVLIQIKRGSFINAEHALQQGLSYLSTFDGVDSGDIARCLTIHDNLIEWLTKASHILEPSHDQHADCGWSWTGLIDNEYLRVGLLSLNEESTIPIHDHPGSSGLLLILEGHLRVQEYQCHAASMTQSQRRIVEMERVNRQLFGPGEYGAFSSTQGNIHSLQSFDRPCLILGLLLSPYRNEDRTWYMSLEENGLSETHFSAVRLPRAVCKKGY